MSIEESQVIDIVSTDPSDGSVTLVATDHLEWSDREHLLLVQEKFNCYLSYIESGEIYKSFPKAKGNEIKLLLVCKHKPNEDAEYFLSKCSKIIGDAGYEFTYRVHEN
ncbi:hypothetical protein P886_0195 [Alteromonadaceae bacterium 2753L.S.0a.02]|nr:hypothetical protein P886_0195 [Alteromonadaceae bacterium 2753L.S.0a.02]